MVEDKQLSPRLVGATQTRTGFEHSTFRSKVELTNQYTKISSYVWFDLKVNKHKQTHQGTLSFVRWETMDLQ